MMSLWASQLSSLCAPPGVDLDEPHPAFDQPPGQQALAAEVRCLRPVDPVQGERLGGLLREVHCLGRGLLHLEGELVGRDPRGELGVVGAEGVMGLVLLAEAIEQQPAGRAVGAFGYGQVVDRHIAPRGARCPDRRPACSRSTSSWRR